MIKFHSERNIKYSEILRILFSKKDLKEDLEYLFPNRYITLTNYGRTAFQLILDKYNLKNCKIMIPAFICSIFKEIFEKNNITAILIDVEKDTFNISPRTLKRGFDKSAKALITNNMNGLPCEVEKLKKVLSKNQLLIEDCAHSLGAYHNNIRTGLYGDAAFFSFYKTLPSISGGFSITREPLGKLSNEKSTFKDFLLLFYYLGKNANKIKSFKNDKSLYDEDLYYEDIKILGPNFLAKKIARFYMKRIDNLIKSRQDIAEILKDRLKNTGLIFQANPNNEHVYTYFSFLLPKDLENKRMDFLNELRKEGVVGKIIWNKPLSNDIKNTCNNSKEISRRIMSLPLNANYTDNDAEELAKRVITALNGLNTKHY